MKILATISILGAGGFGALIAVSGCTRGISVDNFDCIPDADTDAWYCQPEDQDAGGQGGGSGLSPQSCQGVCVPMGQSHWSLYPILLWTGSPEETPPECPEKASSTAYPKGFSGLIPPSGCTACECSTPTCVLPAQLIASTLATCPSNGPGAVLTPYDAPADWDGTCVSTGMISADSMDSVTIDEPTVSDCVVTQQPEPKKYTIQWQNQHKGCQGNATGKCEKSGDACVPSTEPPPPGFRHCVYYTTKDVVDEACPEGYPDPIVAYEDVINTFDCEPCTCGAATGADCTALVSAWQNTDCTSLLVSTPVSLANDSCAANILPSATLGSIEAQWVTNNPGTCQASGGNPIGEVTPIKATLFCCAPVP